MLVSMNISEPDFGALLDEKDHPVAVTGDGEY